MNKDLKKIFVICPVHRRPDLIQMQLNNYNLSTNFGCKHVLHISKEGRNNFSDEDIINLNSNGAIFSIENNGTSWKCTIGAMIACTKSLDVSECDYVYVHTDADLIVKGNLRKYIYEKQLGYSCANISKGVKWAHYHKLINDERFSSLRNSLGLSIDDVYFGRQEGAFYPSELWLKIINKISEFYDHNYFDDVESHWPLEEAVVPTLARYFSTEIRLSQNIVKTKEWCFEGERDNPNNCVTVEDLMALYSDESTECVGLKWFSQDINDDARALVFSRLVKD